MGGALDGDPGKERLVWAGDAGYLQRMRPTEDRRMPGGHPVLLHPGQTLLPAQNLNE